MVPVRAIPAMVAAMGLILVLAAIAEVFVGLKAENVSDLVRPELTDEGLAQHRADFESARQAVRGLRTDVLPAVAQSAGVTPDRLRAQIDANYPAVGRLLAVENEIIPFAGASLVNLEKQQANFESADSAPADGLPAYAGGIFKVILGLIVIASGALIGRGKALPALAAPVAVSAVLIVLPFILGNPGKAADAETVLDSLNPTPAVVARTEESIRIANAAAEEFNARLAPDLASALGTTPAGFQAAIARQSPATAQALAELPQVLERYDDRLAIRVGGAADIRFLKARHVGLLAWFDPAFGVCLAIVAGWAWWAARRAAPV